MHLWHTPSLFCNQCQYLSNADEVTGPRESVLVAQLLKLRKGYFLLFSTSNVVF